MAERTIDRGAATGAAGEGDGGPLPSSAVVWLSVLVLVLAVVAAVVGLAWSTPEVDDQVTSVRGERVELFGEGLYRYDTPFKAGANRGADVITLALAGPVLAASLVRYRRGSLPAALLVVGGLTWFLYVYASLALGTAYNELFLVYVAVVAASLYGLALAVRSVGADRLGRRLEGRAPRRGLARMMAAAGVVTAVAWGSTLVAAALTGDPPGLLDHYTTMVTDVLDLALITPATLVAAYLLHRRRPEGYLLAVPLLVLLVALFPMIVAQTAFQLEAGVSYEPGQVAVPLAGFLVVAAVALPLLVRTLQAARAPGARSG